MDAEANDLRRLLALAEEETWIGPATQAARAAAVNALPGLLDELESATVIVESANRVRDIAIRENIGLRAVQAAAHAVANGADVDRDELIGSLGRALESL